MNKRVLFFPEVLGCTVSKNIFGQTFQINYALNIISYVNLRHRRVEQRIFNYSKAKQRLGLPLSGCFLGKCPSRFLTCDKCRFCYNINNL